MFMSAKGQSGEQTSSEKARRMPGVITMEGWRQTMTQPVCWSKKKRSPQMSPKWKHRHQQTKTELSTQHRCLISKINSAWRSFFLKTIWYVWAVFCLQSRSHPSSFNNLILLNVRQNTVKHSVYKCIIKWRMKQFDQNWWYGLKFSQQPYLRQIYCFRNLYCQIWALQARGKCWLSILLLAELLVTCYMPHYWLLILTIVSFQKNADLTE